MSAISQKHIIQKQAIDISFEDLDDAMGIQNRVAEVFYEKVQPRMEVLLDELFGKNYQVTIDKIEIDCGILHKKNWEQEFADQSIRELKAALLQVNKKELPVKEAEELSAAETFFFFLRKGYLPWNNRIDTIAALEQRLHVNETLVGRSKKLIAQQPVVADRLASQFSKHFIDTVITTLTINKKERHNKLLLQLQQLHPLKINEHIVDAAVLKFFAAEAENTNSLFFDLLLAATGATKQVQSGLKNMITSLKLTEKEVYHPATNDTDKEGKSNYAIKKISPENEGPELIYINNAGLILLHPFLPALFEGIGLLAGKKWMDKTAQHKAILMLGFLLRGTDETEEFNMVLYKILCGMDIEEMVATDILLEEELKVECNALLIEVIRHWAVLKNTSTDGLRATFLQRNGKLSANNNGWLLQVEQKTVDVLLNHLPWGTGIIKLPWMKKLLYVEWV